MSPPSISARAIVWVYGILAVVTAVACGSYFPQSLLASRAGVLERTPNVGFWLELNALAGKAPVLPDAPETGYSFDTTETEQKELSPQEFSLVSRMRKAPTGDAAYAMGHGLSEDIRLYTAGAVEFNAAMSVLKGVRPVVRWWGYRDPEMWKPSDDEADTDGPTAQASAAAQKTANEHLTRAISRFEAVLAMPVNKPNRRSLWASYSLARARALRRQTGDLEASKVAFRTVRALALPGSPDSLGLALSSLGEEARIALEEDRIPEAISLYAQQEILYGSSSEHVSLEMVARGLLKDEARLLENLSDERVQRLLVGHALHVGTSRSGPSPDPAFEDECADAVDTESYLSCADGMAQEAQSDEVLPPPDPITTLARLIMTSGVKYVADVDRLAALQYSAGNFDSAAALVQKSDTALASLLKAKLALRRGDLESAARWYAEAARSFPAQVSTAASDANFLKSDEIAQERGVLALARGEYLEALRHLHAACAEGFACNWPDSAYIAERVLTTDELKDFVSEFEGHPHPSAGNVTQSETDIDEYDEFPVLDRPLDLHYLLARRLMREGRYLEAEEFFSLVDEGRTGPEEIALRPLARAYSQAVRAGDRAWTKIGRAQGWFTAATIAREHGMELFGYEGQPDVHASEGMISVSPWKQPVSGPYMSDDELMRFSATTPSLPVRFHYRRVAASHALRAADHLPPRSQAFAAVLCKAAGWMRDGPWVEGNADREFSIYRRYVREGPYVPWAANFGRRCQTPDFEAATSLLWEQRKEKAGQSLREHRIGVAGTTAALLALIAWAVIGFRRRRSTARSNAGSNEV